MRLKGKNVRKYLRKFMVAPKKRVKLSEYKTGWAQNEEIRKMSKETVKGILAEMLEKDRADLAKAQELFAASRQYSMLIILQGMDTAGKDGTIREVMSGVNPQGCSVHSFKVPACEDHAHDFLWRYTKVLPERGMIGIFNRSYYEDVLVVRVHPDRLETLPESLGPDSPGFWKDRFSDINAYEKHLVRNGTIVLKFFLHISKEEQKKRLLERLGNPEKIWKFSFSDIAERECWDQYVAAYEEMLAATSTEYAPWFIVPADYKWVARTFVAEVIAAAIRGLDLAYPAVSREEKAAMADAKKRLEAE